MRRGAEGAINQAIHEATWQGIESLGRRALALERLLAVARELSTLDLDTVLDRIVRAVLELTGTQRGALLLSEPDGEWQVARAWELGRQSLETEKFVFSRSLVEVALSSGEAVLEDVPSSPAGHRSSVVALGLRAVVALPLVVEGRRLGALYLDTDLARHGVRRVDLDLLTAFATQAALALDNARRYRQLEDDVELLRRSVTDSFRFDQLVYKSAVMQRVVASIRQVAATSVTVLIEGATGTGKELVARAIHGHGNRREKPFLAQNTGALPDSLLEAELFGHRRGAFTGAAESRPGLFEAAQGGTVFLDEIGEASPAFQVRLLRLLETGTFRRLGESAERRVDVRVIAATHRDLEADVAAGRFRADLYYRLSVFPIRLPTLSERRQDIEGLVRHFLDRCNHKLGRRVEVVPAALLARLVASPWPGNVRQLANTIERLVLWSPGAVLIDPEEASPATPPTAELAPATAPQLPFPTLREVERRHIVAALEATAGNLSAAARRLGLERGTLRWRMKRLGLSR